jgi:DNA-binding transcriptional MerR regulator
VDRGPTWTAEELLRRATNLLAGRKEDAVSPEEPGITPRTFRYHRTIGLISSPLPRRGKKAAFSTQHLDEVVAVHRLQKASWDLKRIRLALDAAREDPRLLEALAFHGRDELTSELLESVAATVSNRLTTKGTADRTGPALKNVVVSSVCLAPGVYLVVDRATSGRFEREDAFQVGEKLVAWLTGDVEATRRGHDGREGPA